MHPTLNCWTSFQATFCKTLSPANIQYHEVESLPVTISCLSKICPFLPLLCLHSTPINCLLVVPVLIPSPLQSLFPSCPMPGKTMLQFNSCPLFTCTQPLIVLERTSTATVTSLILYSWFPTSVCGTGSPSVLSRSTPSSTSLDPYFTCSLLSLHLQDLLDFLTSILLEGKKNRDSQKRTSLFSQLLLLPLYLLSAWFPGWLSWIPMWSQTLHHVLDCIPSQFSSVQSLSRVRLSATPWIAARQASLSITNSQSSHKLMSHRVGDAIQPPHPLSSPSPPAPNPSQHQSLFQWVNSSHSSSNHLFSFLINNVSFSMESFPVTYKHAELSLILQKLSKICLDPTLPSKYWSPL